MCCEPTCQLWSTHERLELGAQKEPKHPLHEDHEVLSSLLPASDQVLWFQESLQTIHQDNCGISFLHIPKKSIKMKIDKKNHYLCNLE